MRHPHLIVSLLLPLLATCWTLPGFAEPVGSEFQINTYTTSWQISPVVAAQSDGDFTVVWHSDGTIRSRLYTSDGTPASGEIVVESSAAESSLPDLAVGPSGEFVVTWTRNASNGPDTDASSVAARRFSSDGSPVGNDFQINTYTTGSQTHARVAMDADGDFVIVWQSPGSTGTDLDGSLQGQRFASDGSFVGGEFQVNEWTTGRDQYPDIAVESTGNFIVVWTGPIALGGDDDGLSVQARRFASDGSPVASQFLVNTYTTSDQVFPTAAYQTNGDFVVVWNSYSSVEYPNHAGTRGQRFASNGNVVGNSFQINIPNTSYQLVPSLATEPGGDFTVAWSRVSSSGNDTHSFNVHRRRFAADATPLEDAQQVNTYTTGNQVLPVVAGGDGQTVVVWQSHGSFGTDSDSMSIQGRRFTLSADLGVTITDGVVSAVPGSDLVYELEAVNEGPDGVSGVSLQSAFPTALACSWASVATGGAVGNTASSGDLADTLILPAGSNVTYTVTCGIDAGATGPLSNTATISSAAPDPDASNNNATDGTILVDPQLILQVDVTQPAKVVFRPNPEPSALDVSGSGFHGVTLVSFFDGNAHAVPGETVLCGSVDPLITDGGGDRLGLDALGVAPIDGGWTLNDLKIFSEAGADIDFGTSAPALVGELSHTLASFQGLPAPGTTGLVVAGPPSNRAILGMWQAQSDNAVSGCLVFADGFESGDTSSWNPPSP